MRRILVLSVIGMLGSGCSGYLTEDMRQSMLDRLALSEAQIEQSRDELAKLYTFAYTDSWNWAEDASKNRGWGPNDLADTRNTLEDNRRTAEMFLQKLEEAEKLLNTVQRDIGGRR